MKSAKIFLIFFAILTFTYPPMTFAQPKGWFWQKPDPSLFTLSQNHPNPFQSQTSIRWQQPASSRVMLKVFDFMGREIRTLLEENRSPGIHQVTFNSCGYPSGVYIYQLQANGRVETKKMLIAK